MAEICDSNTQKANKDWVGASTKLLGECKYEVSLGYIVSCWNKGKGNSQESSHDIEDTK